jgi:ACS family tartrate transporter-like MFS transporter
MILGAAGYLLVVAGGANPWLVVVAFCVVAAGADGYFPGFWPLPTAFLTESAAAAAIGLINSFGNLGGFVGPYILGSVKTATNSFNVGLMLLSLSMVIGAGCVLAVRHAAGTAQPK